MPTLGKIARAFDLPAPIKPIAEQLDALMLITDMTELWTPHPWRWELSGELRLMKQNASFLAAGVAADEVLMLLDGLDGIGVYDSELSYGVEKQYMVGLPSTTFGMAANFRVRLIGPHS